MDRYNQTLSLGASKITNMSNNDLGTPPFNIPYGTNEDSELDRLNDETFGDCDLGRIKQKSDFNEHGEFLGDESAGDLPDFFLSDTPETNTGLSLIENNDPTQEPSIDALLAEDLMTMPTPSVHLRQTTSNPLFNMAIAQANNNVPHDNIFPQRQTLPVSSPMNVTPQQIQYQLLKQIEQILNNQQIHPQQREFYIQTMLQRLNRNISNQQQQTTPLTNMNNPQFQNRNLYVESMNSVPIGETMERARLAAMNINNSRSQSPNVTNIPISSQFMDAIQRSGQIPIVDNHRTNQSSPSTFDTIVSPSSPHHNNVHMRQNRSAKSYPRPPRLHTWQGRAHDDFAGLMYDHEKQWIVKIQLQQVSQTQEEDYYFHKWSKQRENIKQTHSHQTHRRDHRGQRISYPILQLLKSIQQEKELADRLSQASSVVTYSNVNPTQHIPYALAVSTQLGKQSAATPRHPRYILDLNGQTSLGMRVNAITHDKYFLGLLLNIENIYRDMLNLKNKKTELEPNEKQSEIFETKSSSNNLIQTIIHRYLNHENYLFADMFAQSSKGQIIFERLYPYIISTDYIESMIKTLYGSLIYMINQCPNTFSIQTFVMNVINLMLQEINNKKPKKYEQLLNEIYTFYKEKIQSKFLQKNSPMPTSPFSDPILLTNSYSLTLLIELLSIIERNSYIPNDPHNSTPSQQIIQQLQPHLQYDLSNYVRLYTNDLIQAFLKCSLPTYKLAKILKPFAHINHPQFNFIYKFFRIQTTKETFVELETKLKYCCIQDA